MDNTVSSSRPSTASSVNPASFLQNLLDRLSLTLSLKFRTEDTCPVAVVALQRYLSEGDEQHPPGDSYSYDLTITDGTWRAKCFLHSRLNHLVHKNILKTGTDICITHCSFIYNERRLGHGYICIEDFTCRTGASAVWAFDRDISGLPVLLKHGMENSVFLQRDVPLQVNRRHHLPLWNNDDPEGEMWATEPRTKDLVLDVSRMSFLCNLENHFRYRQRYSPLLVRVMHKSRLRYYGKHGLKSDFPYQAYLEVADQSGTMSLVLWNDLCPEFYRRLHVGTVLYLQNYTLKESYLNRSRPHMDHYKMSAFNSVEICLNPRNPAANVTIISPKSVLPQWALPEVSYQFIARSELHQLSQNSACDIIGLVTFVGRVERLRSKGNKGPEKYWNYRWIHAIDGTSDLPFILEVFSSSQPEIFNQICPMTYLVCTQMRLCEVDGGLPYLTSSCETQMFITGSHKGQPYVNDHKVISFIQWTKTLKDNNVQQRTSCGGYYSYPRAPKHFTQAAENASAQVPLVAAADLKKEFESLQYREHKRVAVQGQITAVLFIKHPTMSEKPLQTEEPQQDPVVMTECDDEDEAVDAAVFQTNKRKRPSGVRSKEPSPEMVTPKRIFRYENTAVQQEESETENSSEGIQDIPSQEAGVLSWQSSFWPTQQQDVSEHIYRGVLHEDSVTHRFTFEDKNVLLQWSNLHPGLWTSAQTSEPVPPAAAPGYYRITILGINRQLAVDAAFVPVAHAEDPGAVGMFQEPHENTMMSCLSSGFLCPLSRDTSPTRRPQPEEILETAPELEGLHVVCVLDLCHLGGDTVEVLLHKVYRVSEVSLQ